MQSLRRILHRRLFFYTSTSLPKNRVLTSAPPPISSVKSAISVQLLSTHVFKVTGSPRLLILSFNGYTFYKLFDTFALINDYDIGQQQVELYCDMVEQTAAIFDIWSVFVTGLIKAIKKTRAG